MDLGERPRRGEVIGVHEQPSLRMDPEHLARRRLEIDALAVPLADHEIVRERARCVENHPDRVAERGRHENAAPDEGQGHARQAV